MAERATQLKEYVFSALAAIRDYAIVSTDEAGVIVGWNLGAERLLGYPETEAVGENIAVLFTPEDRKSGVPEQELALAARTGQSIDDRWHLKRNGTRFYGSGIVAAIRDDAGQLLGFLKIFRDLSALRHAQERLADSEERYRLLVDSINDYAIFMLDAGGRVTYWTRAAERIMGYEASEIIGHPLSEFFIAADRERGDPDRELQTARETGRAERTGWRVRKDGSRFWGDEVISALHDASGTLIGFSKITRDITERRRAELERERLLREANESNRLKDEFLSTISHELRTPLNAILGWMQVIRAGGDAAHRVSEGLTAIERNARAQARLIDDLLDVSRIVTGKTQLVLRRIALAGPLGAAVDTVKPMAEQKGVQLIVEHDIVDDELLADAGRLQQVIWNVLSNAIKFTPRGGTVNVKTIASDHSIEILVQDSGVGIDPAFLPFVFDRFRQGDTGHSREHGGLGLGLSIVQRLVDLHGGHASVESAGPGQGTVVRLMFPRAQAGQAAHSAKLRLVQPEVSGRGLSGGTVLVVDDDPDALRIMELVLTAHGANVVVAASSREALAAARATRPDVVLSDLSMPAEDGFSLLARLRADDDPALHTACIVAITAHAHPSDREQCLAAGFDEYLPKPVDMSRMIELVADLLGVRRRA
jgi:PAS domain S-box-containing protein